MKVNDGTGQGTMPPEKQALTAYQDAEPKGPGKAAGQGEKGSGAEKADGRTKPL